MTPFGPRGPGLPSQRHVFGAAFYTRVEAIVRPNVNVPIAPPPVAFYGESSESQRDEASTSSSITEEDPIYKWKLRKITLPAISHTKSTDIHHPNDPRRAPQLQREREEFRNQWITGNDDVRAPTSDGRSNESRASARVDNRRRNANNELEGMRLNDGNNTTTHATETTCVFGTFPKETKPETRMPATVLDDISNIDLQRRKSLVEDVRSRAKEDITECEKSSPDHPKIIQEVTAELGSENSSIPSAVVDVKIESDPAESTRCEQPDVSSVAAAAIPELLAEDVGNRIPAFIAKKPRTAITLHLNSHGATNNYKRDRTEEKCATKRPRIIEDVICVEGTIFNRSSLTNIPESFAEASPAKKSKCDEVIVEKENEKVKEEEEKGKEGKEKGKEEKEKGKEEKEKGKEEKEIGKEEKEKGKEEKEIGKEEKEKEEVEEEDEEEELVSIMANAVEGKRENANMEATKRCRLRKKFRQLFGKTVTLSEIEEEDQLMNESIPKKRRKESRMSLDSGVCLSDVTSERVTTSPDEFHEKIAETIERVPAEQDEVNTIEISEKSSDFDPLVRSMPLLDSFSQEEISAAISENQPDSSANLVDKPEINLDSFDGKFKILITPFDSKGADTFAPMSLEYDLTNGSHVSTTTCMTQLVSNENSTTPEKTKEIYDDFSKLLEIDPKKDCQITQQGNTISILEQKDTRVEITEKDVEMKLVDGDTATISAGSCANVSQTKCEVKAVKSNRGDDSTVKCKDLNQKTISSAYVNNKIVDSKDSNEESILSAMETLFNDKIVDSMDLGKKSISSVTETYLKDKIVASTDSKQKSIPSDTETCFKDTIVDSVISDQKSTTSATETLEEPIEFEESGQRTILSATEICSIDDTLNPKNSDQKSVSSAKETPNNEDISNPANFNEKTITSTTETCSNDDTLNPKNSDEKTVSSVKETSNNEDISNPANFNEKTTTSATETCNNDDTLNSKNSDEKSVSSAKETCNTEDKLNPTNQNEKSISSATETCINDDELNSTLLRLNPKNADHRATIISATGDINSQTSSQSVHPTSQIKRTEIKKEIPEVEGPAIKNKLPEVAIENVLTEVAGVEEQQIAVENTKSSTEPTEIQEPRSENPAVNTDDKQSLPNPMPKIRLLHHHELGSRWCPTPMNGNASSISETNKTHQIQPTVMPINNQPTVTPINIQPRKAPMNSRPTVAPINIQPKVAPVNTRPTVAPINILPKVAPINILPKVAPMNTRPTVAPINIQPCLQATNNAEGFYPDSQRHYLPFLLENARPVITTNTPNVHNNSAPNCYNIPENHPAYPPPGYFVTKKAPPSGNINLPSSTKTSNTQNFYFAPGISVPHGTTTSKEKTSCANANYASNTITGNIPNSYSKEAPNNYNVPVNQFVYFPPGYFVPQKTTKNKEAQPLSKKNLASSTITSNTQNVHSKEGPNHYNIQGTQPASLPHGDSVSKSLKAPSPAHTNHSARTVTTNLYSRDAPVGYNIDETQSDSLPLDYSVAHATTNSHKAPSPANTNVPSSTITSNSPNLYGKEAQNGQNIPQKQLTNLPPPYSVAQGIMNSQKVPSPAHTNIPSSAITSNSPNLYGKEAQNGHNIQQNQLTYHPSAYSVAPGIMNSQNAPSPATTNIPSSTITCNSPNLYGNEAQNGHNIQQNQLTYYPPAYSVTQGATNIQKAPSSSNPQNCSFGYPTADSIFSKLLDYILQLQTCIRLSLIPSPVHELAQLQKDFHEKKKLLFAGIKEYCFLLGTVNIDIAIKDFVAQYERFVEPDKRMFNLLEIMSIFHLQTLPIANQGSQGLMQSAQGVQTSGVANSAPRRQYAKKNSTSRVAENKQRRCAATQPSTTKSRTPPTFASAVPQPGSTNSRTPPTFVSPVSHSGLTNLQTSPTFAVQQSGSTNSQTSPTFAVQQSGSTNSQTPPTFAVPQPGSTNSRTPPTFVSPVSHSGLSNSQTPPTFAVQQSGSRNSRTPPTFAVPQPGSTNSRTPPTFASATNPRTSSTSNLPPQFPRSRPPSSAATSNWKQGRLENEVSRNFLYPEEREILCRQIEQYYSLCIIANQPALRQPAYRQAMATILYGQDELNRRTINRGAGQSQMPAVTPPMEQNIANQPLELRQSPVMATQQGINSSQRTLNSNLTFVPSTTYNLENIRNLVQNVETRQQIAIHNPTLGGNQAGISVPVENVNILYQDYIESTLRSYLMQSSSNKDKVQLQKSTGTTDLPNPLDNRANVSVSMNNNDAQLQTRLNSATTIQPNTPQEAINFRNAQLEMRLSPAVNQQSGSQECEGSKNRKTRTHKKQRRSFAVNSGQEYATQELINGGSTSNGTLATNQQNDSEETAEEPEQMDNNVQWEVQPSSLMASDEQRPEELKVRLKRINIAATSDSNNQLELRQSSLVSVQPVPVSSNNYIAQVQQIAAEEPLCSNSETVSVSVDTTLPERRRSPVPNEETVQESSSPLPCNNSTPADKNLLINLTKERPESRQSSAQPIQEIIEENSSILPCNNSSSTNKILIVNMTKERPESRQSSAQPIQEIIEENCSLLPCNNSTPTDQNLLVNLTKERPESRQSSAVLSQEIIHENSSRLRSNNSTATAKPIDNDLAVVLTTEEPELLHNSAAPSDEKAASSNSKTIEKVSGNRCNVKVVDVLEEFETLSSISSRKGSNSRVAQSSASTAQQKSLPLVTTIVPIDLIEKSAKTDIQESEEEDNDYTLYQSENESTVSAKSPISVITITINDDDEDDDDDDFNLRWIEESKAAESATEEEAENKQVTMPETAKTAESEDNEIGEATLLENAKTAEDDENEIEEATLPHVAETAAKNEGETVDKTSYEIAETVKEIQDEPTEIFSILDVKSISKDVFNNMGDSGYIEPTTSSIIPESKEADNLEIKGDMPNCSRCGKASSVVCEQCYSAFYCSVECHHNHWTEIHHLSCRPEVPEIARELMP